MFLLQGCTCLPLCAAATLPIWMCAVPSEGLWRWDLVSGSTNSIMVVRLSSAVRLMYINRPLLHSMSCHECVMTHTFSLHYSNRKHHYRNKTSWPLMLNGRGDGQLRCFTTVCKVWSCFMTFGIRDHKTAIMKAYSRDIDSIQSVTFILWNLINNQFSN